MRALLACAAAAILTGLPTAGAQTVSLTEPEAIARLTSDSPRVRAARAGVDIVRADVLDARRWPNPRVSVSREAVAGVAEHMLTVSQTLPITGRLGLAAGASAVGK